MKNASRDQNRVPAIQGVSSIDGQTPADIFVNPATGEVLVNTDAVPTSGANPSTTITEAVVGTVTTTTIEKTIGITTYRQTIAEDSSDKSITMSSWSEV